MHKSKLLMALMLICTASVISAQKTASTYKTAVGIKFYPGGLSVKHFVKKDAALEGLLYNWYYGARITGLYEFHKQLSDVEGLRWYIGPGAHISFTNNRWNDRYASSGATIGIDGVLGLDYKIRELPINISVDWQPSVDIIGYQGFWGGMGGLGVRYTFR